MRYIKVFFTKIVSSKSDEYWYAYTNRPSYKASAILGDVSSSFSLSIRDRNATTATKVGQDITMWLSSDNFSEEECMQMKKVYGSVAYLQVDADNQFTLMSEKDFQELDATEQEQIVEQVQLSA